MLRFKRGSVAIYFVYGCLSARAGEVVFFAMFMKAMWLPILACLFLISACASAPSTRSSSASFTGLWVAPESEKTSFELDLVQTGDRIEGYHAVILPGTLGIDAPLRADGAPYSIQGAVTERVGRVRFSARKGESRGEAQIALKNNRLQWRILSSNGSALLPTSCELYRQPIVAH